MNQAEKMPMPEGEENASLKGSKEDQVEGSIYKTIIGPDGNVRGFRTPGEYEEYLEGQREAA